MYGRAPRSSAPATSGPGAHAHTRRGARAALGTAATVSTGFGFLGLLFVLVGGIGPSNRAPWIALLVLIGLAVAGRRWFADAPGRRDRHLERERRGF